MRKALVIFGLIVSTVFLFGCQTHFQVKAFRADGITPLWMIDEKGAAFLSRKANFEVVQQWLDGETNILYETRVTRNTDENAEPQVQAFRDLTQTVRDLALKSTPAIASP